jgi:hypothetical protein
VVNQITLPDSSCGLHLGCALTGEFVKAHRPDMDGDDAVWFIGARLIDSEKKTQSLMLLAVKRAVIAYVAMAKKNAEQNIHRVFSRCYMHLDYTPNE